jgi:hypothetical protein
MISNISSLRSRIKTYARERVKTFYGFDEIKDDTERIADNQLRASKLLKENNFTFHVRSHKHARAVTHESSI